MCRIAIVPSERLVDSRGFFDMLEKSNGGHGNGMAFINNENKMQIRKGLKMSTEAITSVYPNTIHSSQVMFHTRMASSGERDDGNCHPFGVGKGLAMCHNGVWSSYDQWAKVLLMMGRIGFKEYGQWSDTRIMAAIVRQKGIEALWHIPSTGVWVVLRRTDAVLFYHSGSFDAAKIDGKWWYASEFDQKYDEHWEFDKDTIALLDPISGPKIIRGSKSPKKYVVKAITKKGYDPNWWNYHPDHNFHGDYGHGDYGEVWDPKTKTWMPR